METACTWPRRAPQVALCYSHVSEAQKASSLWLNSSHSFSGCALIFQTEAWQQGGEDRGISEGQRAGCRCQVMTFKALENLLFPGSTLRACFLGVCARVNELNICTLKATIQTLQTDVLLSLQYETQNRTLHHFLKTWSPNNQHPTLIYHTFNAQQPVDNLWTHFFKKIKLLIKPPPRLQRNKT